MRPVSAGAKQLCEGMSGTRDEVHFRIPDVAAFCCVQGREIWVAPEAAVSPIKLELFTLGTALGIIHFQRGDFPIHGAFVSDGDRAFGLCGASGEGKSTIGLALSRAGCSMLTDDVGVIRIAGEVAQVFAENTHVKLWADTAENFKLKTDSDERIDGRLSKFYVPVPTQSRSPPPRLDALVILGSGPAESEPRFERIEALAALSHLREHTYRPFLISALGLDQAHLRFSAELLSKVRMYRFTRPRSITRVQEGADLLMRQLVHGSA